MKRDIFGYLTADGTKVFVDPTFASHVLWTHCGNVHECVKLARSPHPPTAREHMAKIIAGVCEAFDVKAFDKSTGDGYLWGDLLDLLNLFYAWREKKNPTTASGPSSVPSTGSGSSPPDSPPKEGPSTSETGTGSP